MDAFVKKIDKYIQEYDMLHSGDTVVIGVSGGADSVSLLLVLCDLREKYSLKLKVVHVNHGLRSEAEKEAEYVRDLCRERDIQFILKECDVAALASEKGLGTEEMGRNLRYEYFNEALGTDRGVIAVAHNMNDKAETMLFNLARGTGAKGLAAIPPKRPGLIRPLLCVTRDEIEEFLNERGIAYCTDKSNFSDEYSRNRIRNNVLPIIKEQVSKDIIEHMSETADQLRELNSFAENYAEELLEKITKEQAEGHISIKRADFLSQPGYIQQMLVKKLIDRLVPMNKDITHVHLENVSGIVKQEGNHRTDLPYGIKFSTSYDTISADITSNSEESFGQISYVLNPEGETDTFEFGRFVSRLEKKGDSFNISKEKYTKCFDYDKVKGTIEIRNRLKGDRIEINRDGGSKKLKNFFVDEKIPEAMRNRIPLIAEGNEIIWIVGYRISEAYKVTDSTRNILTITYITEE